MKPDAEIDAVIAEEERRLRTILSAREIAADLGCGATWRDIRSALRRRYVEALAIIALRSENRERDPPQTVWHVRRAAA